MRDVREDNMIADRCGSKAERLALLKDPLGGDAPKF
jgi:hypothetical protein